MKMAIYLVMQCLDPCLLLLLASTNADTVISPHEDFVPVPFCIMTENRTIRRRQCIYQTYLCMEEVAM